MYLRYNTTGSVPCQTDSCGLTLPTTIKTTQPKSFTWSYVSDGVSDEGSGDAWARLSLLESRPRTSFTNNPSVDVLLPNGGVPDGLFEVTGQVTGGSLPVYVRVTLEPRRNTSTVVPTNTIGGDPDLMFPVHALDLIYLEAYQSGTAGTNGTFRLGLEKVNLYQVYPS